jgi:hypothetical protein
MHAWRCMSQTRGCIPDDVCIGCIRDGHEDGMHAGGRMQKSPRSQTRGCIPDDACIGGIKGRARGGRDACRRTHAKVAEVDGGPRPGMHLNKTAN